MIYLVLNLEEETPFVVNICSNKEKAEKLVEEYKGNFLRNSSYVPDFAIIEIDPTDTKDVLWDCYKNEHYCVIDAYYD